MSRIVGFLVCWSLLGVGLSGRAQGPGFHLEGMESRSLPVTGRKMTNVIFPVDVAAGVRVSRDVLVQKVKGVENVIELKALKRDFLPTNLAVYGKDGRLYSFVLHYVEDTSVLDYRVVRDGDATLPVVRLSGFPVAPERLRSDGELLARSRGFLHLRESADGMRIRLKGVYLRDSLLWLSLEMEDLTAMGFKLGGLRVYLMDRKQVKRTATQEVDLAPVYSVGLEAVAGHGRRAAAVGLRPLLVGSGKRLVIEVTDEAGDRRVVMRVKGKVLMRARSIEN